MELLLYYEQEKMFKLLEQKKNFRITNKLLGLGRNNTSVIGIYDNQRKQEFALKIINISDGVGGIDKIKLTNAQKQAEIQKNNSDNLNIVKYIDSFEIGTNYFIQMEKCNSSLQDVIEQLNLNENDSIDRKVFLNYARQLLSGISFLHSRNLFLQNISMSNILLILKNEDDEEGIIKLCDFGCPKEINLKIESQRIYYNIYNNFYPPEIMNMTQQNKQNKKEFYKQDFKYDIWCFGIILYLLLGQSHLNVFQLATGNETFKPIKSNNHDLYLFIQNILIYNPDERPNLQQINISLTNISSLNKKQNTNDKTDSQYFNEGMILKQEKQYNKSLELFKKCLKSNPNHEYVNLEIGYIYLKEENFDECLNYLMKQLLINPNHKDINNLMGLAYFGKTMYDMSLKYLLKQLQINPQYEFIHINIGSVYFNKKMYEEAMIYFLRELEINPNHYEINCKIGDVYFQKQLYDECIILFMRQIEINPDQPNLYMKLGESYLNVEKYDESIKYLKKQLQINNQQEFIHFYLGNAYYKKGMFEESMKYYMTELKINPYFNETHSKIEQTQLMLKNQSELKKFTILEFNKSN